MAEWLKASDCNSDEVNFYIGSNPILFIKCAQNGSLGIGGFNSSVLLKKDIKVSIDIE